MWIYHHAINYTYIPIMYIYIDRLFIYTSINTTVLCFSKFLLFQREIERGGGKVIGQRCIAKTNKARLRNKQIRK